jgi:hypothetical protein
MARFSESGGNGFDYVTTGTINQTDYPDGWNAIQALEASQVDVLNNFGDSLTNVSIPAGLIIYVTAYSITVDSGRIIAYRNED